MDCYKDIHGTKEKSILGSRSICQIPRKTNHQDLVGKRHCGPSWYRILESETSPGCKALKLKSPFLLSSAVHTPATQARLILAPPPTLFPSSAFATLSMWVSSRERI